MSWSAKAKELSNEYKLNELGELSLSVIKEIKVSPNLNYIAKL